MRSIIFILSLSCLLHSEIIIDNGNFNEAIKATTNKAYQHDKAEERRREREWHAKQERMRQNGSSISDNFDTQCNSGDTCFQIVRRKNDHSIIIMCTKGNSYSIGQEKCIAYSRSSRKYASGCGLTHAFAYHYPTLKKAGNLACGY